VPTFAWLQASTNKLHFDVGQTNPPSQTIPVQNTGTSNLILTVTTTITNGGNWLNVTLNRAVLTPNQTTNLTVSVDATQLSPDPTNTASVSISANSSNSPLSFMVEAVHTNTPRLIALEVVQVVQDWSNSVPLIAGKTTTVRAHIQSIGSQPTRVTAKLRGFRDGSEILPPLNPSNPGGFILAATNGADQRGVLRSMANSSLNYSLPPSWTVGTVTLQLATNGIECAETAGTPNDCAVTATFLPPVTPQLNLIHIPWVDTNGVTNRRSPAQISDIIPRVISCYPVTNVDFILSEMPWDLRAPPDLGRVLARLKTRRNADAARQPTLRIYYGVVPVDATSGLALFPGNVGSGNLRLRRFGSGRHTPSHEIGHSLNRDHAPYCGAVLGRTNTPPFPYLAALAGHTVPTLGPLFNGPNALVYGYDHDAARVVSPFSCFELMGYCRCADVERWPSKYTYQALISALTNRFANPAPAGTNAAGDYLFVRGDIDLVSDAITLEPIVTLTYNHDPDFPAPGEYSVRLLDGLGQLIQSVSFDPDLVVADDEQPTATAFLVPVLQNPAIRQVQVLHTNQMRATLSASANPPTVQVLFPKGGENFTGDSVTIAWAGNDLDGDPLTYMVQYSRDNGATWETLNVDLTSTNYVVPRQSLRGTSAGRLRVIASDGFFTATATNAGTFTSANNAPGISIQSPSTGTLFFGNQQIVLTALAYDSEDGVLDGTNIVWSSDLDGTLGSGSRLYTTASALSEGTHLITATATDSSNAVGTAQINLGIQRAVPAILTDLAISQTNEPTGDGLTFIITVENLGPSDATGLKMTDEWPAGTTVVSATSTLGTCTITNGLLTCAISQLAGGESAVLTLQLAVKTSGTYTNLADVKGLELDPVPANNLAEEVAEFTATLPVLQIALAGTRVTISWPATTPTNFLLQSSPSLSPSAWSNVPVTPSVVGGMFTVVLNADSVARYYRLSGQ
jgi:uncharacterized repeat protein (TIGR01451 family)